MRFKIGDVIRTTYALNDTHLVAYRIIGYNSATDYVEVETLEWPIELDNNRWVGSVHQFPYTGDIERFKLDETSRVKQTLERYEV